MSSSGRRRRSPSSCGGATPTAGCARCSSEVGSPSCSPTPTSIPSSTPADGDARAPVAAIGANMGSMADPRSIVEQLVDSMNSRDDETARQLFASNCRFVTATGRVLDVDGQFQLLAHTVAAFPDVQISVERWVVDGDIVVTEELFQGTHKGLFAGLAPTG